METRLFMNLPCIIENGTGIIFSPYQRKIISLPVAEIDKETTVKYFEDHQLIGNPYDCPGSCSDLYQLTIIITSDCNLRCTYCFVKAGNKAVTITKEMMCAAIDKALENYHKKRNKKGILVTFFGGEPTLAIDMIKQAIEYIETKTQPQNIAIKYGITSNGVFSESTLEYLVAKKFFITISMDGLPGIQDLQRPLANGTGSSTIIEKTLSMLHERGASCMVRVTATAESTEQLPEIVAYLAELGVQVVHIEAVSLAGRAIETKGKIKRPLADRFAQKLIQSIETAKNKNISVMNSAYMNILMPSIHYCDGTGGNKMVVTYDGDYSTCLEVQDNCHPVGDKFIIGHYHETEFRKSIFEDAPIISVAKECQNCFAKYVCSGGCPTRNYHINGDVFAVDEFRCKVIKTLLIYCIQRIFETSTATRKEI